MKHLSDCFLPSVWRFVYVRVNGDQHLAEDIVSETVLALIRAAADDGTDIQNPGAWLRSVASNKLTDHFRAAARVRHLLDEARKTAPLSHEEDAFKGQELAERRAEIRAVMELLPEQHRMALEWKYLDRLSVREMAERMDTTEKAVESILFRARREFRERMIKVSDDESVLQNRTGRCRQTLTRSTESQTEPDAEQKTESGAKSGDSETEPELTNRTIQADVEQIGQSKQSGTHL
ncbi:MAG: sigma-70 family RNA polymerase sigma factor [Fuerstiella sp.]